MFRKKVARTDRLVLPRPAWAALLVLDTVLFVFGCLTAHMPSLVTACVAAFLIEKFGHRELFGREGDEDKIHGRDVGLTRGQVRDVMLELRREKREKREKRAERERRR